MYRRLPSPSLNLWSHSFTLNTPRGIRRVAFQRLSFGGPRYSTSPTSLSEWTNYGGKLLLGSAILALGFYAGQKDILHPLVSFRGQINNQSLQEPDNLDPWTFVAQYASPDEIKLAISELRKVLPAKSQVDTNPDDLRIYGSSDNSYHPTSRHSVVVHAHSTEDVVHVVNISRKFKVPIIAYGGATSLEGHFSGVSSLGHSMRNAHSQPALAVSIGVYLSRLIRHG
jgi:hypothetical protein